MSSQPKLTDTTVTLAQILWVLNVEVLETEHGALLYRRVQLALVAQQFANWALRTQHRSTLGKEAVPSQPAC